VLDSLYDCDVDKAIDLAIQKTAEAIFKDIEKELENQHKIYNPITKKHYRVRLRFRIEKLKRKWCKK